jgi:membrane protein involved in colicin uptake
VRYSEFGTFPESYDADAERIKGQKENAKRQLKSAKRAAEQAKQADLQLKQKRSQETLAKINRIQIS